MPFTFLAHQAPIAPLKLIRPTWFSGTALAIGSMAPDLQYFLSGETGNWAHTLPGQFLFCLPITLFLALLVERLMAEPIALHLPELGNFHLRDFATLSHRRHGLGRWLVLAVPSALIGSFSHVVLDAFTHKHGWGVALVPVLDTKVFAIAGHDVAIYKLLQLGGTVVLSAFTTVVLYLIGERRRLLVWSGCAVLPEGTPTRASWLALTVTPVVLGLIGIAWGLAEIEPRDSVIDMVLRAFLRGTTCGFAGLCVGSVMAKRWMSR